MNDLPSGSKVYIDANIFIYHFTGHSDATSAFLHRCETGDLYGVTGAVVTLEVTHRLVILEALEKGLISGGHPARRLAGKPDIVRQLGRYAISASQISRMNVEVLPLSPDATQRSHEYRARDGLLSHDPMIAWEAVNCGARFIASADADFDRVPGLTLAFPNDPTG